MRILAILAGALAITAAMPALADSGTKAKAAALQPKPGVAPEDCVQLYQIRETRVRNDRTIDFYLRGGKILRNSLPHNCPQLGFQKRFAYKTSLSKLCSMDIITVLTTPEITPGASCGLGQFQEMAAPK